MDKDRNNPIEEIMSSAMSKLKTIVDVNTIVGDPIKNDFGAVILPISKVSMGFVAGGGEYPKSEKSKKMKTFPFAGGSGAGVCITPMGFLTIINNIPNFIRVEHRSSWDKVGDMLPKLIENFLDNSNKRSEDENEK